MNKGGHVLNAVLLSIGIGVLLEPSLTFSTLEKVFQVGVPVIIGALFPDIDTEFGDHRQTFHNLPVLVGFITFPLVFDNLYFVWIGVATHYALDLLGTKGGMALLYPDNKMFDLPVGVSVDSKKATLVTFIVTAIEIAALALLIEAGYEGALQATGVRDIIVSLLP